MVLSILAIEPADSICSLYRHFLSALRKKSWNTFNYACFYVKADYFVFMNVATAIALNMIPKELFSQPIYLCNKSSNSHYKSEESYKQGVLGLLFLFCYYFAVKRNYSVSFPLL